MITPPAKSKQFGYFAHTDGTWWRVWREGPPPGIYYYQQIDKEMCQAGIWWPIGEPTTQKP